MRGGHLVHATVPGMYPASTKAADGLPRRAFSADDISRMIQAGILCESERIELIEGDIVVLEPKPSGHDFIKNVLGMTFLRGVPDAPDCWNRDNAAIGGGCSRRPGYRDLFGSRFQEARRKLFGETPPE
jgi:hypothetical protein